MSLFSGFLAHCNAKVPRTVVLSATPVCSPDRTRQGRSGTHQLSNPAVTEARLHEKCEIEGDTGNAWAGSGSFLARTPLPVTSWGSTKRLVATHHQLLSRWVACSFSGKPGRVTFLKPVWVGRQSAALPDWTFFWRNQQKVATQCTGWSFARRVVGDQGLFS